jgi:TolB protein
MKMLAGNNANNQQPAWSPDGKRIIFASNRNGNYELFVMNANGKKQHSLTDTKEDEIQPDWSQ